MTGRVIRLALFLGITTALSIYLAAAIANVSVASSYTLSARFTDVTGLNPGDPVKIAGVPVGQVAGITLEHGQAAVQVSIDRSVLIPGAGTEMVVRWQNLIGQRYLAIEPGPVPAKRAGYLPTNGDGVITHTAPAVDIGAILNEIGPLAQAVTPQELNQIFTAVYEALNGNTSGVATMVGDLESVASTLAGRSQTISQMLADYQSLTGALASRDDEIAAMVDNVQQLGQAFAANTTLVDDALGSLSSAGSSLAALLNENQQQFEGTLDNLASVANLVTDKLPQLEQGFSGLPKVLQALFSAGSTGNFLNIDVTCFQFSPAPCAEAGGYAVP